MMTFLSSFLIGLLAATGPADPQAEAAAREVLQRAAVFQRGGEPLPRPSAFHGRFYVTARKPDGGTINGDVERVYVREPERMWTRREDSLVHTDSTVAWNDGVAWFRDNKSGTVRVYTDDPETFHVDLEQIAWQLDVSRAILDALVVDALAARLEAPRVLRQEVLDVSRRRSVQVDVVEAYLRDELFGPDPSAPPPLPDAPSPRLRVLLSVDEDTGALWGVRMETIDRAEPVGYDVRFAFHGVNPQGVMVPANIKVHDLVSEHPLVTLGVHEDEEGSLRFELDPEIDPARFEVPEDADDEG